MINFVFGNKLSEHTLSMGQCEPVRFLANIGKMSENSQLDLEKKKVDICFRNGIDIVADNSITKDSYILRKWIKANYPMALNTVPIYETFDAMKSNTFDSSVLYEVLYRHIASGSDMLVLHPGLTKSLADKVSASKRMLPVTSRGGAQIYRYMMKYNKENPYYENWEEICSIFMGTGVSLALGISLRAASILDDIDDYILEELDILGELIKKTPSEIPICVEGIGHVKYDNIKRLMCEVRARCGSVPIKTLGPLFSDRMLGNEHINALIGATIAISQGASIIGALFRTEHMGLPSVTDYEESLVNYKMLKYMVNMNERDIELEKLMSNARKDKNWTGMLEHSFLHDLANTLFCFSHLKKDGETCSMCGERCPYKEF